MVRILRGEIYWADLNPVRGREQRPVGASHAVAITSKPQRAGFPLTLAIPAGTLPKPSWLKISHIRTISVERLGNRVATLDPDTLSQAVEGPIDLVG